MFRLIRGLIKLAVYGAVIAALAIYVPKGLAVFLGTETPIAAITSGSMWPTLKKGDLVLIQQTDRDQINIDDIIVWRNPSASGRTSFTIHRVVELRRDGLTTKGDANSSPDIPITYEQVVGKTVEWRGRPLRIPLLGNVTIYVADLLRKN